MDKAQKNTLTGLAEGSLHFEKPMAPYTTIGIGGPAECLYEPADHVSLASVLAFISRENIPCLVVGRGSNLLVTDSGVRGLVVVVGVGISDFSFKAAPGGVALTAGAGLSISELTARCCSEGLSGLEFLAWVPGTVGGAVAMNAGAFGFETGQRVREIHVLLPSGKQQVFDRNDMEFGYRSCSIPQGSVIVKSVFNLQRVGPAAVAEEVARYVRIRRQSQPHGVRSAGSVFKNPPGGYAGALIEASGLKGTRRGGAVISEVHGNFIVNTGGASSEDVLGLMELVRRKVLETSGIDLEPEFRVVGQR